MWVPVTVALLYGAGGSAVLALACWAVALRHASASGHGWAWWAVAVHGDTGRLYFSARGWRYRRAAKRLELGAVLAAAGALWLGSGSPRTTTDGGRPTPDAARTAAGCRSPGG